MAAFAAGESTALETVGTMASGVYHLEKDLQGDLTIPDGATVSIDLRGHDIQGTGRGSVITIEVGGKLTLTDSNTDRIRYGRWIDNSYTLNSTQQEGDDLLISGCIMGGINGVYNCGTFLMQGGNIVSNIATRGGGLFNMDGTVILDGTSVIGNTAKQYGGGIYNVGEYYRSAVTIKNTNVSGNTAGWNGGGIYNYSSHPGKAVLSISGTSQIKGNICGEEYQSGGLSNCITSERKRSTTSLLPPCPRAILF